MIKNFIILIRISSKMMIFINFIKNDDFLIIKNDHFHQFQKNDHFQNFIKNDHFQNFIKMIIFRISENHQIFHQFSSFSHASMEKIIKNDQIFSSKIIKKHKLLEKFVYRQTPKKRDRVSQNKGVCTISLYYKHPLLNPHFCLLTPKNVVDDVFPF